MVDKKDFSLGQKGWCSLDLHDEHYGTGEIYSKRKITEQGIPYYSVDFGKDGPINVYIHNIFESKEKMYEFINETVSFYGTT